MKKEGLSIDRGLSNKQVDKYIRHLLDEETLYICDPRKNKECKKSFCLFNGTGQCYLTTHKEYERTAEED